MSAEHEHVDVVVVGSGFGGSVAAYDMAADGRSVVVLERGRAWPPGSFARTPEQMSRNFWDPSEGHHGLFDIWTFRGLEGVVSSGLGGGSLIYANVLLRKDEKWFVQESPLPGGGYEHWPVSRAELEPHYDTVEQMIGVSPYPYQDTPKTNAMREAAAARGLDFMLPPLAVTFSREPGAPPVPRAELPVPDYGNVHGLPRLTCRLVGECDLGCNDGAKNTLDHTYLSAAQHEGADLRTRHEVKGFRPVDGGGYEVTYVVHTAAHGEASEDLPTRTITCERLVLAAGTFGTSYLLLRNVSALPAISTEALGKRFCGNGDLLTFLLGARKDGKPRALSGSTGPVITSAIRVGDAADGDGSRGRGHYVEDAGYPFFTDWLLEVAQVGPSARRAGKYAWNRIKDRVGDSSDSTIGADIAELIGDGALSNGSLPLLGMGRDVPDGVFELRDGRLSVDWFTDTSRDFFEGVRGTMRKISDHLGTEFRDSPMWLTHRVVTVHPLGGAVMGRNPLEGVCDEYGEVFGHPGLHVMDGALLPGPVGANPSLTIAAVADRACRRIIDTSPPGSLLSHAGVPAPAAAPVAPPPATTGPTGTRVSFTEQMKGFVTLGLSDPQQGYDQGRQNGDKLMFELTITTDDVDRFVSDPAHEGSAVGFIDSDALGGRFEVEQGWFNLFVQEDDPTTRKMLYRLWFSGPADNPMTFTGLKDVHDDPGFDTWRDTSTLYVTILDGHVGPGQEGDVIAAGIITIHIPDFLKQLTTFRSRGERRVHGLEAFGRLFLGQLWAVYGGALSRDEED
jgi:cholesterol oxidase